MPLPILPTSAHQPRRNGATRLPRRAGVRAGSRLEGIRQAKSSAASMGAAVLAARRRRGWTRLLVGEKVGLGPTRIGQVERGQGAGVSLELWYALGHALGMPLRVELGKDATEQPLDAGHLAMQELALRL